MEPGGTVESSGDLEVKLGAHEATDSIPESLLHLFKT